MLDKAFRLAYFILGERTAAIYLALTAADKLKIASVIQGRRLYYAPTGRLSHRAARTKVSLSRQHLLQRLVITEAEPFERLIEGREGAVTRDDMIVRFVKHLVAVSTRRNSFYVALGACRVLHNYTTAETGEIYNLVLQDPDRGRDDYYYRSRKKCLLREMKERFGGSLKIARGHRGEERFQPDEDSGRYAWLVRECLRRFTPWESSCVLPAGLDPTKDIVAPLQFRGEDPDGEHEIELNRIHTLLHPECFERAVATLGLDAPESRLELPRFFTAAVDGGWGAPGERLSPQPLSGGELDAMRGQLERNDLRRRRASGAAFSVLVDGDELAWFEAGQARGVEVFAGEESELVEVRSVEADEEIPLALHHIVRRGGEIAPGSASVRLGVGRTLSFEVKPEAESSADAGGAYIGVAYRAGALGQFSSMVRQLGARAAEGGSPRPDDRRTAFWKVVAACLLAALCVAGLLIYSRSGVEPHADQTIAKREETGPHGARPAATSPSPPPATPPGREGAPASGAVATRPEPRPRKPRRGPPATPGSVVGAGLTRGLEARADAARLVAVRRVYVDALGGGAGGMRVRETLIARLRSSGRFEVVEARDEADAVFKGSVGRAGAGGVSLALRLVNAEGRVIWSAASGRRGRVRPGTESAVAEGAARVLLSDLRRIEGER